MSFSKTSPLLGVVDRYLIREVFLTLSAVAGVLLLILISNRLVRYLGEAASGELPAEVVFVLLSLKAVQYFTLLLPMGFFLAVLLVLGRLYRDNEMPALAACGIGQLRLLRPILGFAALFVLLLLFMSLYVSPWAERQVTELDAEVKRKAEVTGITAGRFKESDSGERIFFVEELDEKRGELHNLFIQQRGEGNFRVQSAGRARLETDPGSGDRFLVMEEGFSYQGRPGRADWQVTRYGTHAVRIEEGKEVEIEYKPESLTSGELWRSAERRLKVELQWRLANPVTVLLFALLAVPLARTRPRQGRYGRIMVALLIYVTYANTLSVARKLLERGDTPEWLGLWWVHLLVMALAVVLWVRELGGWRWLRRQWRGRHA